MVCKLVERNLLLYFLEIVSSLLTRAAICDGLAFGMESCEKTNIAIRVIKPIKLKISDDDFGFFYQNLPLAEVWQFDSDNRYLEVGYSNCQDTYFYLTTNNNRGKE